MTTDNEGIIIAWSGSRKIEVDMGRVLADAFVLFTPLQAERFTCIVGDCPTGVDKSVREYFELEDDFVFNADWDAYGRAAGPIRNGEMMRKAHALIALPGKNSTGTIDCIKQAAMFGVAVLVLPAERYILPPTGVPSC